MKGCLSKVVALGLTVGGLSCTADSTQSSTGAGGKGGGGTLSQPRGGGAFAGAAGSANGGNGASSATSAGTTAANGGAGFTGSGTGGLAGAGGSGVGASGTTSTGGSNANPGGAAGGGRDGGASQGGVSGQGGGRDALSSEDARDVAVPSPNTVMSPNGRVAAEISVAGGLLRYRITVDGKQVLAPSEIGMRCDGVELGQNAALGSFAIKPVDESYALPGNHATAVNRANEASLPVTSGNESYTLDVHVADDGVGVRLRLAAKSGRKIEAERSAWRFDGDPTVWAAGQDNACEQTYKASTLSALGTGSYAMPLTLKVDPVYVSISEAAVKDYGDLAVKAGSGGVLQGYLYADPSGWTTSTAVVQPWRVTIVADDLTALVNSTLVQNLNAPRDPSLDGVDWIRPGRSSWQWMAVGAPVLAEQHQWVDWTQQLGFEYYLIDDGWKAWPDAWNDLKSVITYATSKGVKIWVWVDSKEVTDATARQSYFKQVASTGAVGVKIDFPPACSHTVATWYWDCAKDAAQSKLMLDFHGAAKPNGMERTWPNVLTREAVRGHEYHLARLSRVLEPQHDVIIPFTRFVAGVADYTPTVFAAKDLQGNTWAHELAQAIVFTSPFLCYGGHPQDYLANTAVDVLKAIPAVWDETIILAGSQPGSVVASARRSGKNWFVGILNGASATTMSVSLDFLGTGSWQTIRLGDVSGQAGAWDRQQATVTATDSISVKLSSRGGFVAWFKQ